MRERLGILQFLNELENGFMRRWSTERNPIVKYSNGKEEENVNLKKLNLEPTYGLPDLPLSCQWGMGKFYLCKIMISLYKN